MMERGRVMQLRRGGRRVYQLAHSNIENILRSSSILLIYFQPSCINFQRDC